MYEAVSKNLYPLVFLNFEIATRFKKEKLLIQENLILHQYKIGLKTIFIQNISKYSS
jgi:hypothetical protein